jgi:hypothetical protein
MKTFKISLILTFFVCSYLIAQTDAIVAWEIIDPKINQQFLGPYLDWLDMNDKLEENNNIQETDHLIVTAEVLNGELVLVGLATKDVHGSPTNLGIKEAHDFDSTLIKMLLERKYAWDDINYGSIAGSLKGIKLPKAIINVFQERNFKEVRDIFWWTYRQFDLSSDLRWHVRQKSTNSGFFVANGNEEAGYPNSLSRSVNIGISSEILKQYIIIPWEPIYSFGEHNPIEGAWGVGVSFDSPQFGANVSYQDIELDLPKSIINDSSNVIYPHWTQSLYYSSTFRIPGKRKLVSLINEPGVAEKFVRSPGSLRVKVGLTYQKLIYGTFQSEGFIVYDESSFVEGVNIFGRMEYITDRVGKTHKWKIAGQINVGLVGQTGVSTTVSYNMFDWLVFKLSGAYKAPMTFQDADGNDYIWKPGFNIIPGLSISL